MTSDEGELSLERADSLQRAQPHRHILVRRKFWAITGGSLLLVIFVLLLGVTWFYSNEIQSGAFEIDRSEDEFVLAVGAANDALIRRRWLRFLRPGEYNTHQPYGKRDSRHSCRHSNISRYASCCSTRLSSD